MGTLLGSLIAQAAGMLKGDPSALTIAAIGYVVGAGILIVPPIFELRSAVSEGEQRFAKLLLVLQFFLVLSGLLFFWHGDIGVKVTVRICASLGITAFLKYGLRMLPEFHWSYLFNPLKFVTYHHDCLVGRYGSAYPLSLGIDWLGIGYAFLGTSISRFALLIGSTYLLIASLAGYRATRAAIPMAWSVINALYVGFGLFFVGYSML